MGADAALVVLGVAVRVAVPAAVPALAVRRKRVFVPGLQVWARIGSRAVVEARVITVVGHGQQRLWRPTGSEIGELIDLIAVDDRAEWPTGQAPGQRCVGVRDCQVRLVDRRVEVRRETRELAETDRAVERAVLLVNRAGPVWVVAGVVS